MEVFFYNVQSIHHKLVVQLQGDGVHANCEMFAKFDREYEPLFKIVLKTENINKYIQNQKEAIRRLKYHVSVDYRDQQQMQPIDVLGEQVSLADISELDYSTIRQWMPEIAFLLFDVHRIATGCCFATTTIEHQIRLFGIIKKYFREDLYEVNLVTDKFITPN